MKPRYVPAHADPERVAGQRRRATRWGILSVAVVGVLSLGFYLSEVFNPLLLGLLLAYIFNPLVEALERRKIRRGVAVTVLFGAVLLVMIGTLSFATLRAAGRLIALRSTLSGERVLDPNNPLDQQLLTYARNPKLDPPEELRADVASIASGTAEVFVDADGNGERKMGLPEKVTLSIANELESRFNVSDLNLDMAQLARAYEEHASSLLNVGVRLSQTMRESFTKLGHFFSYVLLVPLYTFFLLMYFSDIREWVRAHLPGAYRDDVVRIARAIDLQVASFFRGKLAVALLKGTATWIGLWVAGVPFAFFIGMGAGMLSIVPLIGPLVGGTLAVILSYTAEGWLLKIVWVVLAFGFAEVVEAVAQPVILGEAVGLSPLSLILSLFVFGKLFGLFGVLLAVPIACIVKTLFNELLLPQINALADDPGGSIRDGPIEPTPVEPAVPSFGRPRE